jgi:O-succinylbenzoate synthase
MRLDRLILREIHLPLREPFRISSGEIHERKILLCELTDADGATVMSECVAGETPNYTPETLDTAWLALTTWIAPRLLGVELAHPRDVHALLEKDFRGHNMAKAAVEMGMWGLESVRRARGCPWGSRWGSSAPPRRWWPRPRRRWRRGTRR